MYVNYVNNLVMNVSQVIIAQNALMDGICYKDIVTKTIVLFITLKRLLIIKLHNVYNVTILAGSANAMLIIALPVSTITI